MFVETDFTSIFQSLPLGDCRRATKGCSTCICPKGRYILRTLKKVRRTCTSSKFPKSSFGRPSGPKDPLNPLRQFLQRLFVLSNAIDHIFLHIKLVVSGTFAFNVPHIHLFLTIVKHQKLDHLGIRIC